MSRCRSFAEDSSSHGSALNSRSCMLSNNIAGGAPSNRSSFQGGICLHCHGCSSESCSRSLEESTTLHSRSLMYASEASLQFQRSNMEGSEGQDICQPENLQGLDQRRYPCRLFVFRCEYLSQTLRVHRHERCSLKLLIPCQSYGSKIIKLSSCAPDVSMDERFQPF